MLAAALAALACALLPPATAAGAEKAIWGPLDLPGGGSAFPLYRRLGVQARWLRAAYEIADLLPSVAGLGWLSLLDNPPAERSENWGLLTSTGAPPSRPSLRTARHRVVRYAQP